MLDFVQFIVSLAPGTLLVLQNNYVQSKDHIVMWYPYNIWGCFPVCKNAPESWMIPPYNVNLLPVYAPTSVCRSMPVKVETARASMAVKPQKPSGLWMPVNGFSFLHFVHFKSSLVPLPTLLSSPQFSSQNRSGGHLKIASYWTWQ